MGKRIMIYISELLLCIAYNFEGSASKYDFYEPKKIKRD